MICFYYNVCDCHAFIKGNLLTYVVCITVNVESKRVQHCYATSLTATGTHVPHSVTCHLAEVILPPLPQPIKAGTRFSDPGYMQC